MRYSAVAAAAVFGMASAQGWGASSEAWTSEVSTPCTTTTPVTPPAYTSTPESSSVVWTTTPESSHVWTTTPAVSSPVVWTTTSAVSSVWTTTWAPAVSSVWTTTWAPAVNSTTPAPTGVAPSSYPSTSPIVPASGAGKASFGVAGLLAVFGLVAAL